jgi:hypothetical protein
MKGAERPPIWLGLERRRGRLTPVEDLYWANKETERGMPRLLGIRGEVEGERKALIWRGASVSRRCGAGEGGEKAGANARVECGILNANLVAAGRDCCGGGLTEGIIFWSAS